MQQYSGLLQFRIDPLLSQNLRKSLDHVLAEFSAAEKFESLDSATVDSKFVVDFISESSLHTLRPGREFRICLLDNNQGLFSFGQNLDESLADAVLDDALDFKQLERLILPGLLKVIRDKENIFISLGLKNIRKFGKSFGINTAQLRTRKFEINGQSFNVRVPLAIEAEEMYKKAENPTLEHIEEKYKELTKDLIKKKNVLISKDSGVVYTDNDIIVGDNSMRDLAKSQAGTEIRIVESFKLLIPIDDTDMSNLTYADINAEFPLPVQLTFVKKIAEVISPNYEEVRKN